MPLRHRCEPCSTSQRACDAQRPTCGRCAARAIKCVYQSTPAFAFVDQNTFSAELSRRATARGSRKQRAIALSIIERDETANEGRGAFDVTAEAVSRATALRPPPLWTLDERVLSRFFARWQAGYTCLGSFTFFQNIYAISGEASAVRSAVLTTAFADLAVVDNHRDCVPKSFEAYLATIRCIQRHLRAPNPTGTATDDILSAIMMIDSFELLYLRRPAPLGSHTTAIVRFLQLRHQEGRHNAQTVEMWRAAYPRLQARQLLCDLPSFDNSIGYLTMLGDNALDRCIASFVAEACDAMYALRRELDAELADLDGFAHQCKALCALLHDTEWQLEHDEHMPKMREIDVQQQCHKYWPDNFYRSTVRVSGRFWIARDWVLFHMCRIKILDLCLDVDARLSRSSTSAVSNIFGLDAGAHSAALRESSQFLLDTIPFLMGLFDNNGRLALSHFKDIGLLIAHYPLWTINQSKHVDAQARQDVAILLRFFDMHRSIDDRKSLCP